MLHRDSPFYIRRWVQNDQNKSQSERGGTIDAPGPYNLFRPRHRRPSKPRLAFRTKLTMLVYLGSRCARSTRLHRKGTRIYNVVTRSNTRGYEDKQTARKKKVTIRPSLTNAPGKPMMCFLTLKPRSAAQCIVI